MSGTTDSTTPPTCPYCDEPTKKLPAHLAECDAIPSTEEVVNQ